MEIVIVAVIGVVILLGVFLAYFFIGDFTLSAATENLDWSAFGSYFGGVAGPFLTFISILLLVYTIRQQRFHLESMHEENIKQDMLRYLNKIDDEITHVLTREIHIGNLAFAQLGDILGGIVTPAQFQESSFKAALEKLMRQTASYCEAIALYRANVNGHFIFRAHQQRAAELLSYLESNQKHLSHMAGATLKLCKMHLEGVESA
ncbi:hypothetical protein [Atopomonas hussainii]|uniref:hypothetical protein n=1 Tax=Atopomonas hussainii TaxID=1429083 RepID=UPI00090042BB|nr:hypothetical protein [Atopomonas hussainii]